MRKLTSCMLILVMSMTAFVGSLFPVPSAALANTDSSVIEPREIIHLTQRVYFRCGIVAKVNYSLNSATSCASGIQSTVLTYVPNSITSPSVTSKIQLGGKTIQVIATYYESGTQNTETQYFAADSSW